MVLTYLQFRILKFPLTYQSRVYQNMTEYVDLDRITLPELELGTKSSQICLLVASLHL